MSKELLLKNEGVINSILNSAEDRIYNLVGLSVKLTARLNDEPASIDEMINKHVKNFCQCWGIEPETIYAKTRKRDVVAMRTILFHFLKYKYPALPFTTIGKHFGDLDHSTVIYGVENAKNFIANGDDFFSSFYNNVKQYYE